MTTLVSTHVVYNHNLQFIYIGILYILYIHTYIFIYIYNDYKGDDQKGRVEDKMLHLKYRLIVFELLICIDICSTNCWLFGLISQFYPAWFF